MTNRKKNLPESSKPSASGKNQTHTSTMSTPLRNHPNQRPINQLSSTNNNIHLIQHPNRYPHPIWKSYLDSNPWTFASPASDPRPDAPDPLPLPPDPTHRRWKNRCYNCLNIGHEQNTCTITKRVCAKCWTTGHEARACNLSSAARSPPFDPLTPRGNLGDKDMPKNRPNMVMVFIPETN